jgi:DMSO/TMAO reductase YedYZ heme-binding membrane subunit
MVYLTVTGQLVEPLEFITRGTGDWTLYLLTITLAVTPLRRLTGWNWLVKLRRMLGLYAFFYGLLHFPPSCGSIISSTCRKCGKTCSSGPSSRWASSPSCC